MCAARTNDRAATRMTDLHTSFDTPKQTISWPRIAGTAFAVALHVVAFMTLMAPVTSQHSADAEEEVTLVNFIEPPPGIFEQFAIASIREPKDCVDIYVLQSKNRHNVPGEDFLSVVRYTIALDALGRYED